MKRLPLFLLLLGSAITLAQKETEHKINSAVFGAERTITVRLPERYFEDSMTVYPVTYVFDGQSPQYRSLVHGVFDFYSQTDHIVESIIVSIHTEDRWEEFIAKQKKDVAGNISYSTKLTSHLAEEVFPYIKSNYRITDFRLGIGHSLGGTFVLHETFKDNSFFDAAIVASPNTSENKLPEIVPEYMKTHPGSNKFVYITSGDSGSMEKYFQESTLRMDAAVRSLEIVPGYWKFRKMENTDHTATFPATVNEGYLLLTEHYNVIPRDFEAFRGKQGKFLEAEIRACLQRKSDFRKQKIRYTSENVRITEIMVSRWGEKQMAADIGDLYITELMKDTTVSEESKKIALQEFEDDKPIGDYELARENAEKALEQGNYVLAASEYLCAFDMGFMMGTYRERMLSMGAFAQIGNIEEAFRQLELLANYFELWGSKEIADNKLLKPLHKDKRWAPYMAKLEENKRKADEEKAKTE